MVSATHVSFQADDRSYYSLLKKEIHRQATELGLSEQKVAEIDIIVAEMTSNLFKYGDGGEILLGIFGNYIELICIDHGPGIPNVTKVLTDGVSTSNTMGHGLGSIKRLSDVFDIYSISGWGTIVLSRVYLEPKQKAAAGLIIRPIVVAKPGETLSGDGLVIKQTKDYVKIMLADGLGHGPEANKAVNEAALAFRTFPEYSPTETFRYIHSAIKKTRGMVANIVAYEFATKTWTSAGIGNIAVRLMGPGQVKNHMSYNGIVGHNIPNSMNDQRYSAEQFNQLILCSDGIKTRWDVARYTQISKHDPAVLAAAIYKDQARRTDDMSVVLLKL